MVISRERVVIYVLIILLIISFVYIFIMKISSLRVDSFNQGVLIGYQNAVGELFIQSETCKPISVFAGNKTLEIIPIKCLKTADNTNSKIE